MKIKKKELRKRLPQLPINYPGPDVVPFDYDSEKARVENLCKRLADNEVEVRDTVLGELPRFIKEVCSGFAGADSAIAAAEAAAVEQVDTDAFDAGRQLWNATLKGEDAANLALLIEKLCLGLFYCMWHSDKPLVQHECALNIVNLMDAFPTPLLRELYLRSMLRTLHVHWVKIDQYRMDKYMAMVRKLCYRALTHLVENVQTPLEAASEADASSSAVATSSSPSGKKSKKSKKGETDSATPTGSKKKDSSAAPAGVTPGACARHPSMLRVAAAFQWEVVRAEGSVGLTMHICDLMLTEMLRCERMGSSLFVAVAVAVPLYAMQRGDFIDKRVMDNFVTPIAAGQLEQRDDAFAIETATILAAQVDAMSVARGTHFTVRPVMVEAHNLIDSYVGVKMSPDDYEAVDQRDERRRVAAEVRAAEDVKMRMSRIAMKHAAAAGAVRTVRRISKSTQPKSKRNPRWKKH